MSEDAFLTWNGVPSVSPEGDHRTKYDVGIFGVPTDLGSAGQGGQEFAPELIRGLGVQTMFDPLIGIVLTDIVNVVDFGDSYVAAGDRAATLEQAELHTAGLKDLASALVCIGGDHSITTAVLAGLSEQLPVIHVDAHEDNAAQEGPETWDHSSWVTMALRWGLTQEIHQFGVRAPGCPERTPDQRVTRYGGGYQLQFEQALGVIHHSPTDVYLTVDMDVVDPAFAPGVAYPEPGGWSAREILGFVTSCVSTGKVRAIDFVECVPHFDVREQTIRLVHRLIYAVVRGVALAKVASAVTNGQRTGESVMDSGSDQKGSSPVTDETVALPESEEVEPTDPDEVAAEGSVRASKSTAKPGRGGRRAGAAKTATKPRKPAKPPATKPRKPAKTAATKPRKPAKTAATKPRKPAKTAAKPAKTATKPRKPAKTAATKPRKPAKRGRA